MNCEYVVWIDFFLASTTLTKELPIISRFYTYSHFPLFVKGLNSFNPAKKYAKNKRN